MTRKGFTLLELMLVLALLGMAGTLVATRLGPLRRSAGAELAAGRLEAQILRCQDLAVGGGWPVRLRLDLAAGTATAMVLGPDGPAEPGDGQDAAADLAGGPETLSASFTGDDRVTVASGAVDLLFIPDRRCERPGTVTLAAGGTALAVRCRAAFTPPERERL